MRSGRLSCRRVSLAKGDSFIGDAVVSRRISRNKTQLFPYLLRFFPSLEPHGFMSSVTRIGTDYEDATGCALADRLARASLLKLGLQQRATSRVPRRLRAANISHHCAKG